MAALIQELQQLHLRQRDLIQTLLDATQERTAPLVWDPNAPTPAERQAVRRRAQGLPVTQVYVFIQNNVIAVGRRSTATDKAGVIYKITSSYVHIQTDSSQKVRRAPHNVRAARNGHS